MPRSPDRCSCPTPSCQSFMATCPRVAYLTHECVAPDSENSQIHIQRDSLSSSHLRTTSTWPPVQNPDRRIGRDNTQRQTPCKTILLHGPRRSSSRVRNITLRLIFRLRSTTPSRRCGSLVAP